MYLLHNLKQGIRFRCDLQDKVLRKCYELAHIPGALTQCLQLQQNPALSFSSGSRLWPQLATGIQVLGLYRFHCKSKMAMPWLDTLVSILSLADRSALSQYSTVAMCCATSLVHSPASAIHGWAFWPKSWHNSSTNSEKAGTKKRKDARLKHANSLYDFSRKAVSLVMLGAQKPPEVQRCPRTCAEA